MNYDDFKELDEDLLREATDVLWKKMSGYAPGEGDALSNFRGIASMLNLPMRQVWAVYFCKHVFSVMTWAATGEEKSEGLRGRMVDIINYCALGLAIEEEANSGT